MATTKPRGDKRAVSPIPSGAQTLTAYLIVKNAGDAIQFYKKAFGAKELFRIEAPPGTIGHAELQIGKSRFMLAEVFPDMGAISPRSVGGSPVTFHLYVKDVDAAAQKAIRAGLKVTRPIADQFYGERSGKIEDPFGHLWSMSSRIEKVSLREMQKRAAKLFAAQPTDGT